MNYGLYLSATGVMANSHRQDVLANNLANVETVGFKRDVTSFQQRLTEAQMLSRRGASNPILENIGGGLLIHPTGIDHSQGELETTGNNLDLAVFGDGYFAVKDGNETRLTRDGRFAIDKQGYLVRANASGQRVLDEKLRPIQLPSEVTGGITIGQYGEITSGGQLVGTIGLFQSAEPQALVKHGGNLIARVDPTKLRPAPGQLSSGFVERSNVDPTTELTQLMDAQRQLEANANMIRYQDQTLGRLVNDVGKMT